MMPVMKATLTLLLAAVLGLALTLPAHAAKKAAPKKVVKKAPVVAKTTVAAAQESPAPQPAAPASDSATPAVPVPATPLQDSFVIEPVSSRVYAAVAKIGGKATSNAMFVIGDRYVVAAGAHMTKEVIRDLNLEIAALTKKPVRYFILAHHHPGYAHVDFDFPVDQDVIMAWQVWQEMNNEIRKPEFPILFFNEGLTLKPGGVTVVLTDIGPGHSSGDVVTYIPEAGVVFASDLVYVNSTAYMGSGHMREWLIGLEFLEQLGAPKIIPGTGPVSGIEEVSQFKNFFREFLSAVLLRVERGDSLEQVLANFDLPRYNQTNGYQQLIKVNLKRAYAEMKDDYGKK